MKKTEKAYWNNLWTTKYDLQAIDPNATNIHQWVNQRFHEYFSNTFNKISTKGKTLLEIGCGGSIWLPYFAKEYNFIIAGLDYSEEGCVSAKKILHNEGISGKIICADLFHPPNEMLAAFDVVVSFGLVEHFENTVDCLKAISKFLKPRGMLITFIPNMAGINGLLQKILNKEIYNLHLPLSSDPLKSAHTSACLSPEGGGYFLSFNSSVINIGNSGKNFNAFKLKKLIFYLLFYLLYQISKMIWVFERLFFYLPATRIFSPYIVWTASKNRGQIRPAVEKS